MIKKIPRLAAGNRALILAVTLAVPLDGARDERSATDRLGECQFEKQCSADTDADSRAVEA